MSKKSIKPKILHIMLDGKKLKCIDGVIIPFNQENLTTYNLVANFAGNKTIIGNKGIA